jgi:acetate kinase
MALDAMIVLTLNSGSSSLKFALYSVDGVSVETLMTGEVDSGELRAADASGAPLSATPMAMDRPEATIGTIARLLKSSDLPAPQAVGHRVVHGGPKLLAHIIIDDAVLRQLEEARALSPLHAPAALATIGQAAEAWPGIPQVACFDTAFHADLPAIARTLPISKELRDQGIHRYGFHGLSCESIVHQFAGDLPSRTIIAHLGSGASITAVRDGRSVDTSMGLTPSGGVIMGTRSGDLDPGILIYLSREKGFDAAALEEAIDHQSGLLGVSGLSGDLRVLHAAQPSNDVELAMAMFCVSIAKQIAAMMVSLGGVDTIVFTGGVGEHDAMIRRKICDYFAWLGVTVDEDANRSNLDRISNGSRPEIRVFPSQEDEQIARHVGICLQARNRDDAVTRC